MVLTTSQPPPPGSANKTPLKDVGWPVQGCSALSPARTVSAVAHHGHRREEGSPARLRGYALTDFPLYKFLSEEKVFLYLAGSRRAMLSAALRGHGSPCPPPLPQRALPCPRPLFFPATALQEVEARPLTALLRRVLAGALVERDSRKHLG